MLRIALLIIILLHGLIHVMGFAKAFGFGKMQQLTLPISKITGLLWLLTAIFFVMAAFMIWQHKQGWFLIAILAVMLSQTVIVMSWQDAKAGTLANIVILIAALLSFTSHRFEQTYRKDVKENLQQNNPVTGELLTEKDIAGLPLPVQKYLRYAGVLNKPKVKSVRIVFQGQMRDKGKDWFDFTSEQYNFFDEPARLFFMKATMFGITVPGYHRYSKGSAVMNIRLFGIYPVVQKGGPVMDKTETVTLFNDMCLLVPSTLIDKRIQWQALTDSSVTATFTNHAVTIQAKLLFNKEGKLVNFISTDRTAVNEMKQYPFSTPVYSYRYSNGYNILSTGEAIWHYPEGDFSYGKFHVKSIEYNLSPKK